MTQTQTSSTNFATEQEVGFTALYLCRLQGDLSHERVRLFVKTREF